MPATSSRRMPTSGSFRRCSTISGTLLPAPAPRPLSPNGAVRRGVNPRERRLGRRGSMRSSSTPRPRLPPTPRHRNRAGASSRCACCRYWVRVAARRRRTELATFYLDACDCRPTDAGLIQLTSLAKGDAPRAGGMGRPGGIAWRSARTTRNSLPRGAPRIMGAGADAPDTDADALALTIRYSIAVDGPPRFRRQALGWLATGAALGGVTADQVVVQCTNAVPDAFRRTVAQAFGVEVTALPGAGTRGTLNKLSQLAHPALDGDWIVLCDCDTAFAEPLPATVFRSGIAAKLVDVGFPDLEFWTDLLGRLGLSNGQPEARRAAKGGGVTYRNNCNGGLYVGDSAHWARIAPEWRRRRGGPPPRGGGAPPRGAFCNHKTVRGGP